MASRLPQLDLACDTATIRGVVKLKFDDQTHGRQDRKARPIHALAGEGHAWEEGRLGAGLDLIGRLI